MRNSAVTALGLALLLGAASCGGEIFETRETTTKALSEAPAPFVLNYTAVYPLTAEVFDSLQFPPPISKGPGQGIKGCGSWRSTGAIDGEGRVESEELHTCGPCTDEKSGWVKVTDTFTSDAGGGFSVDSTYLIPWAHGDVAGPCTIKGTYHGGNCQIRPAAFFVNPGESAPGEEADPRCFNGQGCPLDAEFGCLVIKAEFRGKVGVGQ